MKSLVCGVSLALVLLGIGLSAAKHEAQAAGEKKFPPATEKAFDDAVAKELKAFGGAQPAPGSVPGAVVGVWVPGRGAYVRAVGYSNLSPQQPMALDDKFRVGSNTKTFVITVLLQLVDEHKLSLDDPVSKFDIGVKIPNGEHITVRELCQMRSGLIDAVHRLRTVERLAIVQLDEHDIVRHPLVQAILRAYDDDKPRKKKE